MTSIDSGLVAQAQEAVTKILFPHLSDEAAAPKIQVERDETTPYNTRVILSGAAAMAYASEASCSTATKALAEAVGQTPLRRSASRMGGITSEIHLHFSDPNGDAIEKLAALSESAIEQAQSTCRSTLSL